VALQEADGPSFWSGGFDHVQYLAAATQDSRHVRAGHAGGLNLSYGTALISDLPLDRPASRTFAPGLFATPKGFLVATLRWPGGSGREIDVVSVHLDFMRQSVRMAQAQEMIEALAGRNRPLIVMGDFNCEWSDQEATLRTLATELGVRAHRPRTPGQETFPALGRRLDWILISPELEFVSYRVLEDAVSDHFAVVAEIGVARATPAFAGSYPPLRPAATRQGLTPFPWPPP
jgi:endonuclease/exonuclease/phosphatase family metal-dependent hydrolase